MALRRGSVKTGLWVVGIGSLAWLVFLVLTKGSAILVGSILLLSATIASGLILERVDSSRRPPEDRPHNREGHPEDYWGFRGRPGA